MPDALTLLSTRRSVPAVNLTEPGPSAEDLSRMLTVAARVPDHGKLAPWRFIVIEGDARAQMGAKLAAFAEEDGIGDPARLEVERNRFSSAPVVVAVVSRAAAHPKIPEWEQVLSAGAACMNLVHAAVALGYGAQWLTGWAAYDGRVRTLLGLAEHEKIAGFVHIGTPTLKPEDRPRPDLEALVSRWTGPLA